MSNWIPWAIAAVLLAVIAVPPMVRFLRWRFSPREERPGTLAMLDALQEIGITLKQLFQFEVSPTKDGGYVPMLRAVQSACEDVSRQLKTLAQGQEPSHHDIVARLESIERNLVSSLVSQKKLLQSVYGQQPTEDDEIIDRVREIRERYPQISWDEAVKRAKNHVQYAQGMGV